MAKVAFIGLGVMGAPMAGHLKAAGHEVRVYNRSREKAEIWAKKHGGEIASPAAVAASPAEAAAGADFVFACVGNDDDLRAAALGNDGAFGAMKKGAIFIDNTTASAELATELHGIAKTQGIGFIDAPVSGGQAGAEGGVLTVMCGGDQDDFDKAKPVILSYAKIVNRIGGAGAGQLAKMVNQICIGGLVQGLAEGINFGQTAGLDMKAVLNTISGGAAQSWQMVNRGETMVAGKFDFGFAIDWMIKDFRICQDAAKQNGAKIPVTETVLKYYEELSEAGFGREDTSALIKRLK